jgi:hypothetical protein
MGYTTLMRDMIPPGERSIRNIPIPRGHRHIPPQELPDYQPPEPPQPRERLANAKPRGRRPGRFILWALAIIFVCAGGVAGVSMLYAGASVKVLPRTDVVSIAGSTTLPAQINAPVGTLSYSTVSATQWATTTVPATGTKRVSRQASGTVAIASTYSASQRLVSGTRLEAPDGKIYKLASSIDLPADSSATVGINAESPGESYNRSGATTFTFVGFKGDPRFEKFSARSQGAIAGGFIGEEPAVAAADLEVARAKLKADLDMGLERQLESLIPETSTAIPGTLDSTYGELMQSAGGGKDTATIAQSAMAQGATLKVRDLASAIARKFVRGYGGEAVDFGGEGSLAISVATSSKPGEGQLALVLSGDTTLVWQFDPNALKEAMLGKDKNQFQTIVESFAPAIKSATATVRPFWIKNFPSDPEQIKIEIDAEN